MEALIKTLLFPFKIFWIVAVFLFKKRLLNHSEGAKFAKPSEYRARMNPRNKGLLLDGESLKLAEKESFQNACIIAKVGAGKTSRYIIPNVLERAKSACSVVVNDPKGEVYEATSGHMKANGFRVVVINPENLANSSTFNPLAEARDDIELDQIAEILIKAGSSSNGKDDFWANGAIRFVSVFLSCLRNAGRENPAFNTLHNLYFLFQNFGDDGAKLDTFISRYSINPEDPSDRRLWNEWNGCTVGNDEGVKSFVLNGITALKAMKLESIARLTASSSFRLETLRQQKTVVYFITPPQHQEYYSFLTSLFFRSVFNASMRRMPDRHTLPLYVLYDEFGQSTIPNFASTATTIRAYKVSLSIVLQSIAQLSAKYGKDTAQVIQGGFHTLLAYSASDPETALFFERIIGKTRYYQTPDYLNPIEQYREQSLLLSNEIRTMKDEEVLIVSGNQDPVLIPSKAYFQVGWMKRATSRPPAPVEGVRGERLEYVSLD
jgi:type IV secretory pathway TraG/TraD family ATPase VirD4